MDDDRDLISIGPEKTYALIVGIDDYPNLSSAWQLCNPVLEARKVARWLLERGVPASRIQCFLAQPAAKSAESLRDRDGQELQCQRPTMQSIQDALLATPLPELPEGSTLIFYWAGHGQLGRDSKQLLYDMDFKKDIPRVYDFTEVMRAFALERWARLSRQILLVNACANWDTESHQSFQTVSLNVTDKDLGNYFTRQQFAVYSSPPGEYAWNGEESKPSPFFEKVFGVLQQLGNRGSFSEEELTQQIDETIKVMRPRPRTIRIGFNRVIWDPPFDCKDAYFNQVLASIFSQWFEEDIDLRAVSIDRFQKIFKEFFNDQKPNPKSMKELMSRLISQPEDQKRSHLGKVVDFFLHVVEEFNKQELFEKLKDLIMNPKSDQNSKLLNRKLPGRFDVFVLNSVRNDIKKHRKLMTGIPPFYLSFYLTSGEDTAEFLCCIVHDGKFNKIGDHRMQIQRREKVEETFRKFYTKTIHPALNEQPGFNGQDRDVHFRFYLPAEMINEVPVHRFIDPRRKSSEVTVAQFSPVTLASYERATGKSSVHSLENWEGLFNRNSQVAGTELSYQSISPNWPEVKRRNTVNSHHWLGFDQPPTPKLLDEMIDEGAPFLIWPWQATDQWPQVVEELKAFIGGTTLQEAHKCLPDLRSGYPMGTDQLVVFWDDYERNGLKHLQGATFTPMFGE